MLRILVVLSLPDSVWRAHVNFCVGEGVSLAKPDVLKTVSGHAASYAI
jgi:hypothetical protein